MNFMQRELEKLKKVEELNISSLLKNGWEQHYLNRIWKEGKTVHVQLCVKKGTASTIMILPTRI